MKAAHKSAALAFWVVRTLFAIHLLGCSAERDTNRTRTEVMLRIDTSSPAFRRQFTKLSVSVAPRVGDAAKSKREFAASTLEWPVDLPVLASKPGQEPAEFAVIVRAFKDGELAAQTFARTAFIEGESRVLKLRLGPCPGNPSGLCSKQDCERSVCRTCSDDNRCVPVELTDPRSLPKLNASDSEQDGNEADPLDASAPSDAELRDTRGPAPEAQPEAAAQPEEDECESAACDAHASCIVVDGNALCTCNAPYLGDGKSCLLDANCETLQCDAHASCKLMGNKPSCECLPGYAGDGRTCTDVDECAAAKPPCSVVGTCKNTPGAYECTCKAGYEGDGRTCTSSDHCLLIPCANGAPCSNNLTSYTCDCSGLDFNGPRCDVRIDGCVPNPCRTGGVCTDLTLSFKCSCADGYFGETCQDKFCSNIRCGSGEVCDPSNGVCRPQ
jgi:hypothetical protein